MAGSRLPWSIDGVTVITELSTAGDLINTSNTSFIPFTDSNGDGVGDLWFINTTDPQIRFTVDSQGRQNIFATYVTTAGTVRGNLRYQFTTAQAGKQYRIDMSYGKYPSSTGSTKTHANAAYWCLDSGGNSLLFNNIIVDGDTQAAMTAVSITLTAPAGTVKIQLEVSAYANTTDGVNNDVFGVTYSDVSITLLENIVPSFTWMDISCDVKGAVIRHGRTKFTEGFDVGTLGLTLANDDGDYTYKVPHPFGLRPGRIIRMTATYNSVTYPLFFGIIDSITDGYGIDGKHETVFALHDVTTVASNVDVPNIWAYKSVRSGTRINNLLDYVGYFNRAVDAGQYDQQPITQSARTVRDEIGVGSDSEGGSTFGGRSGEYTFKDRTWPTTDNRLKQVQAEFIATVYYLNWVPIDPVAVNAQAPHIFPSELITDWSLARVINKVTLANRGGSQKTYQDDQSVTDVGPRTHSRLDFLNYSDSTLPTRANDYLVGNADPKLRLNNLSYRANGLDSKGWIFTLTTFLLWLIRVSYQHPTEGWGWQIVTHVQSVTHDISPKAWSVRFEVDQPYSFKDYTVVLNEGWDMSDWDIDLWDDDGRKAGAVWNSGQTWNDPLVKWG